MKWVALLSLFCTVCANAQSPLFWPHLLVPNVNTATNTTFGLQNWWKFDENGGVAAVDSADSASGWLTNSPTWVPGLLGPSALAFKASNNQFIQLTNNVGGSNAISITFWALITATNTAGIASHVIDDNDEFAAHTAGFSVNMDQGNFDVRFVCSGTDLIRSTITTIPSNSWFFCAITWNGTITDTNTVHLYTNAVENTNWNVSQNGVGTHAQNTTTTRYIGRRSNQDEYFDGVLDDIRIYNRVLNGGELTNLFNYRY